MKAWIPARGSRRGPSVTALNKANGGDDKDKLEQHDEFDDGEGLEEEYETPEDGEADLSFNDEEDKCKESW